MEVNGWGYSESPFHTGELQVQAKLGLQQKIDQQGRRFIRPHLTEQHRDFFGKLPYLIVGTVDSTGAPWASILLGTPGFVRMPDLQTVQITIEPLLGDPMVENLHPGSDIGLLGIELATRRRNRINGIIRHIDEHQITINVTQTFGNCPQYIQLRSIVGNTTRTPPKIYQIKQLSTAEQSLVYNADTCFIATAYQDHTAGKTSGVDVSHRGGKPGFIRIDDDTTLTMPDFSGNNHFNTIGNLVVNPKAGLLFMDFHNGDLLYLTGTTEIIWDGDAVAAFAGAERLIRFHLTSAKRVNHSLPLHWSEPILSPFTTNTGSW